MKTTTTLIFPHLSLLPPRLRGGERARILLLSIVVIMLCLPATVFSQKAKQLPVRPLKPVPATSATVTATAATLRSTNATLRSTNANVSTNASLRSTGATVTTTATKVVKPALPPVAQLVAHGRFFITATHAYLTIAKQDFQTQDYSGLTDILAARLSAFPLFLGGQGLFNHLSVLGASPRDVAVMLNGRNMNDAAFGAFLLDQFPQEMMDCAEIFIGSDAAIIADNAAGAAINLQEIRHNTRRPFTRIWFQQSGAGTFGSSDGTLSYNVANDWNLTLGYRRQSTDGQYANSGVDGWNIRAMLRWSASSNATLSLSYLYTQHRMNLNGGLESIRSTDAVLQIANSTLFSQLRDNQNRHDITLTGSLFLDEKHRSAASGSVFVGTMLWERGTGSGSSSIFSAPALQDSVISSTFSTLSIGAAGRIETQVRLSALTLALTAGGNIGFERVGDNAYLGFGTTTVGKGAARALLGGFARGELDVSGTAALSGGVRLSLVGSQPQLSIGAKLSIFFDERKERGSLFFADLSRSFRNPSVMEGLDLSPEGHLLAVAGVRIQGKTFSAEALGYYRVITNPILATSETISRTTDVVQLLTTRSFNGETVGISSRTVLGASVSAQTRLSGVLGGNLLLSGFVQGAYSSDTAADKRFPLLFAGVSAQYEYIVGRSILRIGVRANGMTAFRGERFVPTSWSYIPSNYDQSTTSNGIDIIAGAEVGNAYIRVTYQNLLDQKTFTVPLYPIYGRSLKLGLSFTILD